MSSPNAEMDRQTLRQILKRISESWLQGRTEELNEFFHDDMVIVGPGFQVLGKGREVCVQSYADFIQNATVQECKETEPVIEVWGDTAVATFGWEIAYEMKGTFARDTGHDLFVFGRHNGRWMANWREVFFTPTA